MTNLIEITPVAIEKATNYNPDSRELEPKLTKDGKPVFAVYYEAVESKEINGKVFESKILKKVNSLIELEVGKKYLVTVELFSMNNKIFPRILKLHK